VQESVSSRPAQVSAALSPAPAHTEQKDTKIEKPAGKCPFGFDKNAVAPADEAAQAARSPPTTKTEARSPEKAPTQPVFLAPDAQLTSKPTAAETGAQRKEQQPRMLFTGPVFIGYSAEDAAKILRESGLGVQPQ